MLQVTVADIPICVDRKNIKNMYLRVYPDGSVRISAPRTMPEEKIRTFAQSRAEWIVRQLEKQPPADEAFRYADGEMHALWGQRYPIRLLPAQRSCSASFDGESLLLYVPEGSTLSQRKAALDALYRTVLQEAIVTLRSECEALVGRQAAEYRIRDMRTRWGSCSISRRRIWISLQLAKYDRGCLRYVMIHELTHLLVPDHGPRFRAYMDRFCPG